jgi:hypothetical protein
MCCANQQVDEQAKMLLQRSSVGGEHDSNRCWLRLANGVPGGCLAQAV